jgi:hypothetical protein
MQLGCVHNDTCRADALLRLRLKLLLSELTRRTLAVTAIAFKHGRGCVQHGQMQAHARV